MCDSATAHLVRQLKPFRSPMQLGGPSNCSLCICPWLPKSTRLWIKTSFEDNRSCITL